MVTITLVGPRDCQVCEKVKEEIEGLKTKYPQISIEQIDAYSLAGEELVLKHGILASPGILVNDTFIGSGSLPLDKLKAYLTG
jgi:glutaredoxin